MNLQSALKQSALKAGAGVMLAASLSGCLYVHETTREAAPPVSSVAPAPAAAPVPPPVSVAVANPTYAVIPMEIDVDGPIDKVWARVGKYCDIAEWFQIASGCSITAGKDGEVGAVRTVGKEILVGKTPYSYTYTQPVRNDRPYNLYHGTLEARAIGADKTRLVYTLMYDNSMLPDDAARTADIERRRAAFMGALRNMKTLAEGGTLPPRAQ
ncbi:MAG: SRPBCC family protein [Hyphomonadaceae bacterium]